MCDPVHLICAAMLQGIFDFIKPAQGGEGDDILPKGLHVTAVVFNNLLIVQAQLAGEIRYVHVEKYRKRTASRQLILRPYIVFF